MSKTFGVLITIRDHGRNFLSMQLGKNKKSPAVLQERSSGSAIADTGFFFCKDQIIDIGLILAHIQSPPYLELTLSYTCFLENSREK